MEGASTSLAFITESKSIDEITTEEILNDEPETKIIKLSEKNLDPLEYFARFLGIPELILQHLNLVKISEVSPSYYNFIASSKILMKKFKIVFDEKSWWMPEDYDLIKNSSRIYQNVEVRPKFYDENRSNESSYFNKRIRDLWNFLALIESSVESVVIICKERNRFPFYDSYSNYKSFKVLKFPKLKQLKFHIEDNSSLSVTSNLFINSIAVEKLELEVRAKIVKDGILTKMLENFDKLTSLKIRSSRANEIFKDESWKLFKFKLKSLSINFNGYEDSNCHNFLKSQSDHLEDLKIVLSCDKELFDVIMKMPKLESLYIQNSWILSNNVRIEVSSSITDLKLKYCAIERGGLKFLLQSMPNVKRLSIFSINREKFQILLSTGRKFEEINYHKLERIEQGALTEISDKVSFQLDSFFDDF